MGLDGALDWDRVTGLGVSLTRLPNICSPVILFGPKVDDVRRRGRAVHHVETSITFQVEAPQAIFVPGSSFSSRPSICLQGKTSGPDLRVVVFCFSAWVLVSPFSRRCRLSTEIAPFFFRIP